VSPMLTATALAMLLAGADASLSPDEALARIEARYRDLTSLQLEFTESHTSRATGRTLTESGGLLAARPRRMRWQYETPEKKLFVLNGDLAWFWLPEEELVYRMRLEGRDSRRLPALFLTGEAHLTDDYQAVGRADDGSIELRPRSGSDEYETLLLSIDPATYRVTALQVVDALGNVTRFDFSAEEHDVTVPDGAFEFEPPPGTEIVDSD